MKIVRSLGEITADSRTVVTVGTFDGVHLAHREIIREVMNRARMMEGRSVVITFEPHPKSVVGRSTQDINLLSTIDERIDLLSQLGPDVVYVIPFTYEFSRLTSGEFYERHVIRGTGVSEVVVGYDHMFGRDREAGIEELVRMGQKYNFSVFALHPFMLDGEVVSSTRVRTALLAGNVTEATKFLGRPYILEGRVVRGDGRGKTIGYPTANIAPMAQQKLIPANGVYLAGVRYQDGQYFGMMNIGVRPSVTSGTERTIEVHLFDFQRSIYGESITITFLRRLREEKKFSSVAELVAQLDRDKHISLKLLTEQNI